jgi:hypothetical protein
MYFIFKHVKNSPYRDMPGKYYHYTTASPNHRRVKRGARVLCYQKETDRIFARARVGKVMTRRLGGVKNYYAYYEGYEELEGPVLLEDIRRRVKLRDLRRPSPGIIPLDEKTFVEIIKTIGKTIAG